MSRQGVGAGLPLVLASLIGGCGSTGSQADLDAGTDASLGGEDAAAPGCPPGTLEDPDGGACRGPGVDACGDGFEPDGAGGCEPILPATDCGPGFMAVPGETECHTPAACAEGTWGDIPVDERTVYVDASYRGGGSSGTRTRPYTSIQDAVRVAPEGAIVAVAAGRYEEEVGILTPGVQLWGRCPELVEVVGQGVNTQAILVQEADGAEVHALSVTGPQMGVASIGAVDVRFVGLRVHDTGLYGVAAVGGLLGGEELGESALRLEGSLVENSLGLGVQLRGASAVVERSLIRDTTVGAGFARGHGIELVGDQGLQEPGALELLGSRRDLRPAALRGQCAGDARGPRLPDREQRVGWHRRPQLLGGRRRHARPGEPGRRQQVR